MSWEQIEDRLAKPFIQSITLPSGTIWLPEEDITIDQWLLSAAESDAELRELDIPAINFLQTRWPMEQLVEWKWPKSFDRRSLLAMSMAQRAYILFGDGFEYRVVAAVEPKNAPALYRAAVHYVLENASFVPDRPTIVHIRPDLIVRDERADEESLQHVFGGENFSGIGGPVDWMHPGRQIRRAG
jgi:hypothetical protein